MILINFSWNSTPFWPKKRFSTSKTGQVINFLNYLGTQQPHIFFCTMKITVLLWKNAFFPNFQFHYQAKQLWGLLILFLARKYLLDNTAQCYSIYFLSIIGFLFSPLVLKELSPHIYCKIRYVWYGWNKETLRWLFMIDDHLFTLLSLKLIFLIIKSTGKTRLVSGLHKTWYPGNGVTSQSRIWQPKWLAGPPAFSNPGSQVGCQPSQPASSNLVANLFKMMQPKWLAGRACGRLNDPLVNATTKSLWGGCRIHQEPWPHVYMWIK